MLAGLFLSLYGIGKQIRNAFWFGFIRFCFHEMSGERCMGWEYLRKMMETTYVGKRRLVGEWLRMDGKDIFNQTIPHTDKITPKPPQKNEQNIR